MKFTIWRRNPAVYLRFLEKHGREPQFLYGQQGKFNEHIATFDTENKAGLESIFFEYVNEYPPQDTGDFIIVQVDTMRIQEVTFENNLR